MPPAGAIGAGDAIVGMGRHRWNGWSADVNPSHGPTELSVLAWGRSRDQPAAAALAASVAAYEPELTESVFTNIS
jgi:hypothetical protein